MSPRLRSAALVGTGMVLPGALEGLAKVGLRYMLARLRKGDMRLLMLLDRPDVRMRFPGTSSFATQITSKQEHREWLERFVALGVQLYPDEIIFSGPPWRQTFAARVHDHADAPDGRRIYENRAVMFGYLKWGRLADYEVYEDTEATLAYDRELAQLDSQQPQRSTSEKPSRS